MKSSVVKRSVVVAGHKTSVSLEDAFWDSLREIARSQAMTLSDMIGLIDGRRENGNLSSTIRLFVLEHARARHAAQVESAIPPLRHSLSEAG